VPVQPVPEGFDYDFWLGPAPSTPYTDGKAIENPATQSWKTWWVHADYALGFIAGWGVHPLDIAYWGHPALMEGRLELDGRGIIPSQGACNTAIAYRFVINSCVFLISSECSRTVNCLEYYSVIADSANRCFWSIAFNFAAVVVS
jgi:hypothetical protein